MTLDLANLQVERDELRAECEKNRATLEYMTQIDIVFQKFQEFRNIIEKENYSGKHVFMLDGLWEKEQHRFADMSNDMNQLILSNKEYVSTQKTLISLFEHERNMTINVLLALNDRICIKQGIFCFKTCILSILVIIFAILVHNRYYGI